MTEDRTLDDFRCCVQKGHFQKGARDTPLYYFWFPFPFSEETRMTYLPRGVLTQQRHLAATKHKAQETTRRFFFFNLGKSTIG